jgi:hypothetical protein
LYRLNKKKHTFSYPERTKKINTPNVTAIRKKNDIFINTVNRWLAIDKELMQSKFKKIVFILFLFAILLPFIFITDFYPFLRFGMFSEPLSNTTGYRVFQLQYKTIDSDSFHVYNPELHGMSTSLFDIIVRRYYYENKTVLLCDIINRMHNNSIKEIQIIEKNITSMGTTQSTLVFTKVYEK